MFLQKNVTVTEATVPPRIYPPFEHLHIQPSQNISLPPRIYPLFYLCPSQNLPSPHNIPLPPIIIYIGPFNNLVLSHRMYT